MTDPGPIRPADMLFPQRRAAILNDTCVTCGGGVDVHAFESDCEAREYRISGLCGDCQRELFNVEGE